MNFDDYTDDDLDQLRIDILTEQERRATIDQAEQQVQDIQRRFLGARDVIPAGQDYPSWIQPTGSHDTYPLGHIVHHNGADWESLTPANVWEPGVSGWRQVAAPAPDPETPPAPPAWTQPTGAHDAYPLGSQVTHNGRVWESVHSANVWAPPTEWKDLGAA